MGNPAGVRAKKRAKRRKRLEKRLELRALAANKQQAESTKKA